jgi:PAS domain S-box-containing protein
MRIQNDTTSAAAPGSLTSEPMLRRLIDGIEDYAIFVMTPEGVVASWNRGAQRIKGYDAGEIIGRNFSKFYPEEALAVGWPATELKRAAEHGRFEDEGWRVRKDGSRFWANVVITALRGDQGELLGFSKVTRDLSERRRREQRLQESEERLRLLVDGARDHAVFMLDADGRVASWNIGAERVHRFRADEILGRDVALLYPAEDAAAGKPRQHLAAARTHGFVESLSWRVRADGSRFWADSTITVTHDKDGGLAGFVQVTHDLTERLRIEQLETEGRRLNEFLAMLAHELRNPLAPIVNAVGLLEKLGTTPELRWCAELIGRQSTHLTRLVDDLLDISRISSGKIRLRREPLELGTVVATAIESVRPTVAAFQHTLDVVLPPEPLHVSGDPTRLTQVIVNLLGNSAKYTPQGGRLQLRLERSGTSALVRVIDNGIGMSEAMLQSAFDLFVQGERELDRSGGGLGIGLTLVKRIVELHGGGITATSGGRGKGTEMIVSLPLLAEAPETLASPTAAAAPPPGRSVLVVDDNVDAATSLASLLELSGHRAVVAHDGAAALQTALHELPEVVLLDLGLPGMNGYEIARRLRELPQLAQTRLVAMTGYGREDDKLATRAAGIDAHLVKPVEIDAVLDAIEGPQASRAAP